MAIPQASDQQIQDFLSLHTDWTLQNKKLHREYEFKNFVEAFRFMTQASVIAESHNHHPEWCNAYNKIVIDLTTHEAGGITARDFTLAIEMENIVTPPPHFFEVLYVSTSNSHHQSNIFCQ